jgi:hypothetical protein
MEMENGNNILIYYSEGEERVTILQKKITSYVESFNDKWINYNDQDKFEFLLNITKNAIRMG